MTGMDVVVTMDSMLHHTLEERLRLPTDANNNTAEAKTSKSPTEKYQLRPRSTRSCLRVDDDEAPPQQSLHQPAKGRSRCRQRPAPLSKYRRKTANARERSRMREINAAFEALRKAVPGSEAAQHPAPEKVTKIATLKLAMKYIQALSAALTDPEPRDFFSELLLESDGESGPLASPAGLSDDPSLSPVAFDDPLLFQSDFNDQAFLEDDFGDFL